ncbi:MAG: hypothetical protein M1338_05270 [Patescibacteria group bacterium]|nr:hypothetical protein [Patescibacteria group bacterium]
MRFLTLIFGTMGSGKTAELFKIINKFQEHNSRCRPAEKKNFLVFKPTVETRSAQETIVSRHGQSLNDVIAVSSLEQLAAEITVRQPEIVIIDECQFFEIGQRSNYLIFIQFIDKLLAENKQVILCGLIQDCYGGQFKILSYLCAEADEIINPHTTCRCGQIASRSQRLQMGYPTPISDPVFVVDDSSSHNLGYSYEPRCNNCWEVPSEPHPNLMAFRQVLSEQAKLKAELKKLQTT